MIGALSLVIALSGLSIVLTLSSIAKELSRINDKLDRQEQKETE